MKLLNTKQVLGIVLMLGVGSVQSAEWEPKINSLVSRIFPKEEGKKHIRELNDLASEYGVKAFFSESLEMSNLLEMQNMVIAIKSKIEKLGIEKLNEMQKKSFVFAHECITVLGDLIFIQKAIEEEKMTNTVLADIQHLKRNFCLKYPNLESCLALGMRTPIEDSDPEYQAAQLTKQSYGFDDQREELFKSLDRTLLEKAVEESYGKMQTFGLFFNLDWVQSQFEGLRKKILEGKIKESEKTLQNVETEIKKLEDMTELRNKAAFIMNEVNLRIASYSKERQEGKRTSWRESVPPVLVFPIPVVDHSETDVIEKASEIRPGNLVDSEYEVVVNDLEDGVEEEVLVKTSPSPIPVVDHSENDAIEEASQIRPGSPVSLKNTQQLTPPEKCNMFFRMISHLKQISSGNTDTESMNSTAQNNHQFLSEVD